jgi:hypothetical protein
VYDLAGVMADTDRRALADDINAVERDTSAQVAVVTVTSLDGLTVEDYGNRLFNAWGIGDRERHNGVMFLVAPSERKARSEVGYGLEPLLPDEVCGDILASHAIPRFKAGDYSRGILDGTREILRMLRDYPDAARDRRHDAKRRPPAGGRAGSQCTASRRRDRRRPRPAPRRVACIRRACRRLSDDRGDASRAAGRTAHGPGLALRPSGAWGAMASARQPRRITLQRMARP